MYTFLENFNCLLLLKSFFSHYSGYQQFCYNLKKINSVVKNERVFHLETWQN